MSQIAQRGWCSRKKQIKKSLHKTFSDQVFETHSLISRHKPPGMTFKSLNGLVPKHLPSKFVTGIVLNYARRDTVNKLVVSFPRTNYMKNRFKLTEVLPFGTAYPVTLESLVH